MHPPQQGSDTKQATPKMAPPKKNKKKQDKVLAVLSKIEQRHKKSD